MSGFVRAIIIPGPENKGFLQKIAREGCSVSCAREGRAKSARPGTLHPKPHGTLIRTKSSTTAAPVGMVNVCGAP
ncbi:MAG: hypothetical protein M3O61_19170, partial [Gemmatimonadota bacterium]|nr:hypothetical protein [Gemmatimonadota bacterium]